jgi:hypothetical protein
VIEQGDSRVLVVGLVVEDLVGRERAIAVQVPPSGDNIVYIVRAGNVLGDGLASEAVDLGDAPAILNVAGLRGEDVPSTAYGNERGGPKDVLMGWVSM